MNHHVTVYTDHAPLKHLQTQPIVAPRIARWLDFLSDFDLDFVPIPGTKNPADAVSRRPDYLEDFLQRQAELAKQQEAQRKKSETDDPITPPIDNRHLDTLFHTVDYPTFSAMTVQHDNTSCNCALPSRAVNSSPLWGNTPPVFFQISQNVDSSPADNDLPYSTHQLIPDPDFIASLKRGYESDSVATVLFDDTKYKNEMLRTKYKIIDNLIYRDVDGNMILYIPATSMIHKNETTEYKLREELLRQCHDVPTYGHQGREKTYELLSRNFYWPGMLRDVADYVYTCKSCQRAKPRRHKPYGQTANIETPVDNWSDIAMDLITDLPKAKSGNDAVFVVMDLLSKRAHFLRCKTKINAVQTARLFFDEIHRLHGIPTKIVSDRDGRFTSKFWTALFKLLDTKLAMSTPFHPNTDPAERVNQSLEIMLRMYANDNSNDWDEYLPAVEFAYNNSVHSSTHYTPFFLDNGRHPITPASLVTRSAARTGRVKSATQFMDAWREHIDKARHAIDTQKTISKYYRDKRLLPKEFAPGELVWISSKHVNYPGKLKKPKFSDLYLGPVEVISALPNKMAYKLKLPANIHCHDVQPISRLEPYRFSEQFEHPELPPDTATVYSDGSVEYTVEAIVDKRYVRYGRGGRTEYLVKYENAPAFENEWKPEKDLRHCQRAIDEYNASHPTS